jgi:hypothetical protein
MKKWLVCKCSFHKIAEIVNGAAKTIKGSCKWQLIAHSCKCIGCILEDFF